jgi:hypothetical protein
MLKLGSVREEVRRLQARLKEFGFLKELWLSRKGRGMI